MKERYTIKEITELCDCAKTTVTRRVKEGYFKDLDWDVMSKKRGPKPVTVGREEVMKFRDYLHNESVAYANSSKKKAEKEITDLKRRLSHYE